VNYVATFWDSMFCAVGMKLCVGNTSFDLSY
jgi:hypothetical protein